MLSSDSNEDEDEIQATSVFGASESKDSCQKPEVGMEFSSELRGGLQILHKLIMQIRLVSEQEKGRCNDCPTEPLEKDSFFVRNKGFD